MCLSIIGCFDSQLMSLIKTFVFSSNLSASVTEASLHLLYTFADFEIEFNTCYGF